MEVTDMAHDESLAHFGVKGMRWGVHKDRGSGPSGAGATTRSPKRILDKAAGGSNKASDDFVTAKSLLRKSPQELNNQELKTLTTRLELEKKYKQLNPNKAIKGKLLVAGVIGTATMGVQLYNIAHHPATKAGFDWIKKASKHAQNASNVHKFNTGKTLGITAG
jgi:hypothetical protein